jgi:O-acetyl-ADP-ribose deacetylase (regulator of RNase III)/uncharacterized protein YwgA
VITVRTGDILESKMHALVNTVNCVGVMGKGIALAFKNCYPAMFEDYAARCQRGELTLGHPYIYSANDGHIIVNFPTKNHWRAVSRLADIVEGLHFLESHSAEWGIRSIAVPPLGCGNGQLEWKVVGPTLYRELSRLDIEVELFAPLGTPRSQMQLSFFENTSDDQVQEFIDASWVALVEAVYRIEKSTYHWPVGRTRFQKLAYFLESVGVPMGFEYSRGEFGPYTSQLRPVVSKLVNNGILVEVPRGSMISMEVGPTFEDARSAYESEIKMWDPEIDRVVDLFVRMRTDQTEIAATVHYVANELTSQYRSIPTDEQLIAEVLKWKINRGNFDLASVTDVVRSLAVHGWIQINPVSQFNSEDGDLASIA